MKNWFSRLCIFEIFGVSLVMGNRTADMIVVIVVIIYTYGDVAVRGSADLSACVGKGGIVCT